MPVLMYSPGVRVVIETTEYGMVDITDDLQSGSLTITENQPATFTCTFLNQRRKYDGVFTPNDVISVRMKRLRWLPVFAGYLDQVPYFSVYPRPVTISATDTLKRLKYRLWDAGSQAAVDLLTRASEGATEQTDAGMARRIIELMTKVGDWPETKIHIGAIPTQWAAQTEALRERLASEFDVNAEALGLNAAVNGSFPGDKGHRTVVPNGKGTGALPTNSGKVMAFGGAAGGAYQNMHLSKESGTSPNDDWYTAMRWPYTLPDDPSKPASGMTRTEYANAQRWWNGRKLLVINRNNNRIIVVRAADWGPRGGSVGHDRVIGISRTALQTLGVEDGDIVDIRFAENEQVELGLISATARASRTDEPLAPATPPPVVEGASGSRWTSKDSLKGNVAASREFIKSNWQTPHGIGGYANRPIGGTGTPSDHSKGLALDVMVSAPGTIAKGADLAKGNAIAQWFISNPNVFGTKYVIWMDRSHSGAKWKEYGHPSGGRSNTYQHRDHVHISFNNTGQTAPGPVGGAWPQSGVENFSGGVVVGSGAPIPLGFAGGGVIGSGLPLSNAFNWTPTPSLESTALAGVRALMNDTALLPTIKTLCEASMRSFMAAPNGDFIAWFPDYFGQYGTAARITIKDIELAVEGFTMAWDDSRLVTHQYAAGAYHGNDVFGAEGLVTLVRKIETHGIATVEMPELMQTLFNIDPSDPRAATFLNSEAILQRYGARVNYKPMGMISSKEAEFWYACQLFQKNWAAQFSSTINLTFMPEIWPGMLVHLETFGFQAYVESVTHTFNFGSGGGFETSVKTIAPSATNARGLYALPRAGTPEEPPPGVRKGGYTVL